MGKRVSLKITIAKISTVALLISFSPPVGALSTQAFQNQCSSHYANHTAHIRISHARVTHDYTKPISHLRYVSQKEGVGHPSDQLLGLTVFHAGYSIGWDIDTIADPVTQQQCGRLNLKINLHSDEHLVYVANEFPAGSCAHQHILNHELTHVQINEQHLRDVAKELKVELDQELKNSPLIFRPNANIETVVNNWVKVKLGSRIMKKIDHVQFKHQRFDSPQEYARSNNVCNQEIPRILTHKNQKR